MDEPAHRQALSVEALLDTACKDMEIAAFRDLSFIPALEKVLEIPRRLNFSAAGLEIFHANLLRFLTNRLRYQKDVAEYPEILNEDVSDPIVVIGLPRSGTTKLQRILSANPAVQAAYTWRMFNPAPLRGEARGDPTPRIEWAQAMASVVAATNADFNRIHEFDALQADETCYVPLANFDYVMQWIPTPCPIYLEWARAVPRTSPLSYLKRMLQYLQWQDGGRRGRPWVLKNPGHTGEIAEFLKIFPNATFVIGERDIADTMASNMQMVWEIHQTSFPDADRAEIGRGQLAYWSRELDRYQTQRRALGSHIRIVEASYRRLLADPIGIARDAYALHGYPLTEMGEEAMRAWERGNPPHKFGKFHYDLADFGLTAADVEKAFGPIAERWRNR